MSKWFILPFIIAHNLRNTIICKTYRVVYLEKSEYSYSSLTNGVSGMTMLLCDANVDTIEYLPIDGPFGRVSVLTANLFIGAESNDQLYVES